jgi:hypothetical protein
MPQSATDKALMERIENDFTYHAPTGDKAERHQWVRESGKSLAKIIAQNCPPGREQSLALTKVEEAVMWANAAIARQS